jgi:hypothetical protein
VASPRRLRRVLSEEDKRKLMTQQASLTALTKHPSWPTLMEVADNKCERVERAVLARAMSSAGLEPKDAAHMRGLRDGIRYLIAVCEGAEDRLESYLKATRPEGE